MAGGYRNICVIIIIVIINVTSINYTKHYMYSIVHNLNKSYNVKISNITRGYLVHILI